MLDVVKFLVSSSSVNVNTKKDDGSAPLHTASRYGQLDIIKFLVSLPSVDLNTKTSNGSVLLHIACRYGHLDIVKFQIQVSPPAVVVVDLCLCQTVNSGPFG